MPDQPDEPDSRTADLGFARLDLDRARRTGDPEVVYGAGKTPEQVATILRTLHERHPDRAVLATRLAPEALEAAAAVGAEVHETARLVTLGPLPAPRGRVLVVAAGTSDLPVATEAALTARVHGAGVDTITDVGVAGLHRILAVRERLDEADCLIVVAGMEGALPSVVGGLVGVPLVAVPTSVGYGASFGGVSALLGMLNSCAPGVTVVNIDNGYGAGVFAARVARNAAPGALVTLWVDASAGASGDMLLGALVGAGVPVAVLQRAVDAVAPEPVALAPERVQRAGFAATRCHVRIADSAHHRTWRDIRDLLDRADLDEPVRELAQRAFLRLATAEAAVHGSEPDDVHFHEVGALDAIADVVGVCAGFVHLGTTDVVVSPVAVGSGTVEGAHGTMPVPPPAVTELLRGVPSLAGPGRAESCTPTGAALLTAVATSWGPQPAMSVAEVGVGAGGRDPDTHANVLRILVGETSHGSAPPLQIETNVDDLDPRVWPSVIAALLDAGASDAWLTPILMKKGRPAHTLSVLCSADRADAVRTVVWRHTSSIGVRETPVGKHALDREMAHVEVGGHRIAVKLARHDGAVVNAQPEYDDVARAAVDLGRPVKDVLADAVAAAQALRA